MTRLIYRERYRTEGEAIEAVHHLGGEVRNEGHYWARYAHCVVRGESELPESTGKAKYIRAMIRAAKGSIPAPQTPAVLGRFMGWYESKPNTPNTIARRYGDGWNIYKKL